MCNCVRLHDKTIKIIKKNGPPYTEEGGGEKGHEGNIRADNISSWGGEADPKRMRTLLLFHLADCREAWRVGKRVHRTVTLVFFYLPENKKTVFGDPPIFCDFPN